MEKKAKASKIGALWSVGLIGRSELG